MTKFNSSSKHQSFFSFEKERIIRLYNFIKRINIKSPNKEISPFSLAIKSYKEMMPQCKSIFHRYVISNLFSAIAEGLIPITSMLVYNSLPEIAKGSKNAVLIFILFYGIYKIRDILGEIFIAKMFYNAQKLDEAIHQINTAKNYIDNPGEITVIAGTSGEGKTTLMSLIRHDYDLTSGTIKLGTKNITSLTDETINKQIAFIDQNVHFFDQTLLYNLKYFKETATDEELNKALDSAGLTEDISNLKDGLYHKIGQDGRALSGGQRQRLALARIFLTDRPIMILDEPTTGLDQVLSFKVMKTLKEKAKNKTMLLVTHNPTEIALADRVIIIKNGQIESDGSPLDLIETSPFLKASLTKQDIISKNELFSKIA